MAGLLDEERDVSVCWSAWRSWLLCASVLAALVCLGGVRLSARPAQAAEDAAQANASPKQKDPVEGVGRITGRVLRDAKEVAGAEG